MGNLGMGSANFMEMQQRMQVRTLTFSSSSSSECRIISARAGAEPGHVEAGPGQSSYSESHEQPGRDQADAGVQPSDAGGDGPQPGDPPDAEQPRGAEADDGDSEEPQPPAGDDEDDGPTNAEPGSDARRYEHPAEDVPRCPGACSQCHGRSQSFPRLAGR